jgi:hypothetical protein
MVFCSLKNHTIGKCLIVQRGEAFAKPRDPNGKLKIHYDNLYISHDTVPLK